MYRSTVAMFSFAVAMGCSSGGSSGSPGAGGNLGQPGCTTAPECGGCLDCLSKCICNTGDTQNCPTVCGLSGGGGGGVGAGTGTGGAGTGGSIGTDDLAAGIRITQVSVYQAVKIPIMDNGAEVTNRNAQIVAGRDALIRVSVSPDAGFVPREIVARLTLEGPGAGPPIEVKQPINGASDDSNLGSTLNLQVPGAQLAVGSTYSVSLLEAAPGGPAGAEDGARFPATGQAALGAQSTGPALNITLVPVVVNGFTPGTSPGQVQILHDRMLQLYPIPEVKITVRQPVNYSGGVSPTSTSGWSALLNFVESVRSSDNPPKNTYYFGMLTPASSSQQFCGGGCIAGLSNQPSPNDVSGRTSIGLGFFQQGQNNPQHTMAHEVGHAHGLGHAPCTQFGNIFGVDPNYPYPGGKIGVWGYDIVSKKLINPAQYTDIMGYCQNEWVSDYNYQKWFTRLAYVNSTASFKVTDPERAPGTFRTLIVGEDGSTAWGYQMQMKHPQGGEKKTVQVLDSSGKATGSVTGFWTPHSHGHGGFLRVRVSELSVLPPSNALKVAGATALSVQKLADAPN